MHKDFVKFGQMLWEAGLIHLTSGNMSLRKGDVFYVTRTGSLLGRLTASDIVTVNVANAARDKNASSETPVHRAIYKSNPLAQAVVHAHPPHATAISWDYEVIRTIDSDSLYIPEIPVLTDCAYGEGSQRVAAQFPKLLSGHKVALIRGHGAFSVGKNLEEATARISMMENQCRLIFLRRLLERK